jgi:hypothetical protein
MHLRPATKPLMHVAQGRGECRGLSGRREMPVYVVEYVNTFGLPVPDYPASPMVFTEEMFRGES